MQAAPSKAVIHLDEFQPFESRVGHDTVMKLLFEYDTELIALLKRCLREYKAMAVDPAKNMHQPGGWSPQYRCWWVEKSIWPLVRIDLEESGYRIEG